MSYRSSTKRKKKVPVLFLAPKIRQRLNRQVHELDNQEIWSGFFTQSAWQWNITLTSVVLKILSVIQVFEYTCPSKLCF